jgi:RHS repeat-associated protein
MLQSFMWGLDLSGTQQGAGGIGGLVAMSSVELGMSNFVAYDGNGNVAALVKVDSGEPTAGYEYSAFGETLRATGPHAKMNPFRFSTRYEDAETGMVYYGFRYYRELAGRWLTRDPIEETGGLNLYAFANNQPIDRFDKFGLRLVTWTCTEILPRYYPPSVGGPWQFHSVVLHPANIVSTPYTAEADSVTACWRATVCVRCRCTCRVVFGLRKFTTRPKTLCGTRESCTRARLKRGNIHVPSASIGKLLLIPPTELAGGVGKAIAAVLQKLAPALGGVFDPWDQDNVDGTVMGTQPNDPSAGAWVGGTPCNIDNM